MKLIFLVAMLALGGCQTIELASGVINKLNASINQGAQALHDQCLLLQATAAIGAGAVEGTKVQNAVEVADIVVNSYCVNASPTDIPSALAAVSKAYKAVVTAKAQAVGVSTVAVATPTGATTTPAAAPVLVRK